jgi:capsule polysaccharide export protein KpsE/RkpR
MSETKKYNMLYLLDLFTKWRKVFIVNILLVGIISLVVSFLLPKWYKASAIVLPPEGKSIGSGFASLLSSLPIGGLGLGSGSGSELTYIAILKSENIRRDVIEKYNLQEFYEKETMYETLLAFDSDYDVQLTEENMIMISYEYTDSLKVAEIVNYIVDKLGQISTKLTLERAENAKTFIETRYFENLRDIDSLSNEMKKFQNKYGVLELEEQTKAMISSIADIEANVLIKKAELEAIEKNYGKNSPQFNLASTNLETLVNQFDKLKKGKVDDNKSPFSSLFLSLETLPELSQKYAKLYSEIMLQAKLQEFLLPEYEQAKLQLLKKKPTLQVLDNAVPPDKKSKPKKAFVILGAVLVAFIINFIFMIFIEHLNWMKTSQPNEYSKIEKMKKAWLNPFSNKQ